MSWESLINQADSFAGDLPPFQDFRQVIAQATERAQQAQYVGDIAKGSAHRSAFVARVWESYERRRQGQLQPSDGGSHPIGGQPSPGVQDDRDLDIAVAEAIGYRWYNNKSQCNLVSPYYYESIIEPSMPVIFKPGKSGEVKIVDADQYMWPALPMFSVRLEWAFRAAELIGLFECFGEHHGPNTQGYVLTRIHYVGTDWLWHVARLDDRGILQGYVAESTPSMAICKAIVKFTQSKGV